ncbi:MAG: hypothetical protein KGL95_11450, partial [Patescibacteria group bacterium]|nr:hypothetical protein [Patescibacteria group bacterium]
MKDMSLVTDFDLVKREFTPEEKKKIDSLITLYKKLTSSNASNVKLDKLSADTKFGLCNFFYNAKNFDDALELLEDIVRSQPNNAKAILCKVTMEESCGMLERALKSCDRVLCMNPRDIDVLQRKSTILSKLTRREEAIACFDEILKISPRHEPTLYNKGMVLLEMTRREEAIAC